MLASTLKEYVVLRVDKADGFHREIVAESAIEGEALRVGRMLSEEASAFSPSYHRVLGERDASREISHEVRRSATGEILDSFEVPARGRREDEDDADERLLEFPMCLADDAAVA